MERELLALTVLERFGGEMCFHSGTTAIPKRRVFGRLATEDRGVELAVSITGGSNNANPSLRSVPGIATSDSILTLPVEDSTSSPSKIMGFLQVFITQVNAASGAVPVNFATVILNALAEEEEGGSRACGGDGDSFRGDEEGGGGSRTLVTGPGGSLFLIQLALPDGSSEED